MEGSEKNVTIIGLGRSGLSAARYLAARGWRIAVTDSRRDPPGKSSLSGFAPQARATYGRLDSALLEQATLVIVSPGVALDEPIFDTAKARGLEIIGDIELFARAVTAPVIAITGTNGKSTVTTLVGQMAVRAGLRVAIGGNLGTPALDLLDDQVKDLFVLELSSFQLDSTQSLRLLAGTVLNVSSDHMDRYSDLSAYAASKLRIYKHCEIAVVNLDDPCVVIPVGQQFLSFSLHSNRGANFFLGNWEGKAWLMQGVELLLPVSSLRISGLHNIANSLAALALATAAGIPRTAILAELREFKGLDHRCQWVADIGGVRYINDSKGTNVGATLAAVSGLAGTLVLIAGGDGKGQDFSPLVPALSMRTRLAILIGRDAKSLATSFGDSCPVKLCDTLEEAVDAAATVAEPGDTVLLSPACASQDMFCDYVHRGEVFVAAVGRLLS
ncbi:MAG: UDP-N-acetylmuramoyl-L-alanine--D-glutamate ligase [Gammaproteobacteria bacterium]|nr:UDP-N-acetylmuramoyl-L-alanine--D-glutamate ligase [Gammaproteobacteria bacterium]